MSAETATPYLSKIPILLNVFGQGLDALTVIILAIGMLILIATLYKKRIKNRKE
jgi:hypothetical protein